MRDAHADLIYMYVRTYVRTVRSRVFTCVHVKRRQLQVPNFEFVTALDL